MPLHMLPRTQIQRRENTQTRARTYGGENYSMFSHDASAARKLRSCWYLLVVSLWVLSVFAKPNSSANFRVLAEKRIKTS